MCLREGFATNAHTLKDELEKLACINARETLRMLNQNEDIIFAKKLFGIDDIKNVSLSKLKAINLLAYVRNIVFSVADIDLCE